MGQLSGCTLLLRHTIVENAPYTQKNSVPWVHFKPHDSASTAIWWLWFYRAHRGIV